MTEEKTDASIVALEKYIENAPNDKGILRILWKAYYKKGDTEKANQYKARLDAAK
jgi:DNA-binding SARP family transcriptional activator